MKSLTSEVMSFLKFHMPPGSQLNAVMLAFYSAALRRTSSLQATSATVAFNILFSGQMGRVLYGEQLVPQWWLGLGCLAAGVALVHPTR